MKDFLEEYGFSILASIVVILLIAMATPVGNLIKKHVLNIADNFAYRVDTKINAVFVSEEPDMPVVMLEGPTSPVNGSENVIFRSSAPLSEFIEVRVNDEVVDPSNYDLSEGSTIVEFRKEYIANLLNDNYNIEIISESGTAAITIEKIARGVWIDNLYYVDDELATGNYDGHEFSNGKIPMKIFFNANGGQVSYGNVSLQSSKRVTIWNPNTNLINNKNMKIGKYGYKLIGWADTPDAKDSIYFTLSDIIAKNVGESKTIYAVWEQTETVYDIWSKKNNIITFIIDGYVYYAEEGMTWSEWLDSEYNALYYEGFLFNDFFYIYNAAIQGSMENTDSFWSLDTGWGDILSYKIKSGGEFYPVYVWPNFNSNEQITPNFEYEIDPLIKNYLKSSFGTITMKNWIKSKWWSYVEQ